VREDEIKIKEITEEENRGKESVEKKKS